MNTIKRISVPLLSLFLLREASWAQTQGALAMPSSVVSRQTHGGAGPFDVSLPLTGKPGVECRSVSGGSYVVVLTFPQDVTFTKATLITASPNSGSILSTNPSPGASPAPQVTVNLSNVGDGQTIKLALLGVKHDGPRGPYQNDVSVEMGIRVGDVNGDGVVNTVDRTSINNNSGPVNSTNFRNDLDRDGSIGTADRAVWMSKSGATLSYTTFNFSLNGSYKTSAGVFRDGRLIRTLWSGVPYAAGSYTSVWDGNDDNGVPAGTGSYEIRLLQHNVHYIFDGAVGNTSSTQVGPGVHNNSCFMRSLVLTATRAYYAVGEGEGEIPASYFDLASPQTRATLMDPSISTGFDIVATDGNVVYVSDGGSGWDYDLHNGTITTFITAKNVLDNQPYNFSGGSTVQIDNTHSYNAIDVDNWTPYPNPTPNPPPTSSNPNQPTGLAVQQAANGVLAVAHGGPGGPNEIRLFNKVSGARLAQTISVSNPQSLATDSNGDLWVISGTTLKRYTNVGLTSTPVLAQTVTGFSQPIAVAVSPANPDLVLVADGGTSQLVRAFRAATTVQQQLWSYGMTGGWTAANGPDVTDNPPKFQFQVGGLSDIYRTALAVKADGSFFVGDGATNRLLHVNSSHTAIIPSDTIMFLTRHDWTAADPNNPRRVIGDGWLEFDVDYSKPIQTAWTLKKNWAAGLDLAYMTGLNAFNGLHTVTTLTVSGASHVFGTIRDANNGNQQIMVELPQTAGTPLRICRDASGNELGLGIIHQAPSIRDFQQTAWLSPDGAIRYPMWSGTITAPRVEVWERTLLTNLDVNNNPQWTADSMVASAPYAEATDPASLNDEENIAYPLTSSGKFVMFETGKQKYSLAGSLIDATGFHLGALSRGDFQGWSWKTSPAVTADLPFDGAGSFDLGDGVGIPGIVVKGLGKHIIYSYPGESWNGTEASQLMHYYDDGLFVGQFGTSGDYGSDFVGARPGFSGNSFYPTLVGVGANSAPSIDGDLYLYSNDQADHSGVIRWHIIGGNAILEQSNTGSLGSTISLVSTPGTFPTGLTATPGNGQVTLSWTPVSGTYTVKQATVSGGPYTAVGTSTQAHKTITGLTNGTQYFFVVSAGSSPNSNEVSTYPFNTVGFSGQMSGGLPGAKLEFIKINSLAPLNNQPALMGLSSLFGGFAKTNVGTKGYVIYNWAGGNGSTPVPLTTAGSPISPPITNVSVVTSPGTSDWYNENGYASSSFIIDGNTGVGGNSCLNLRDGTSGLVNITVSDTAVHYLTVFSPDVNNSQRGCTVALTPLGQTTPLASFPINDLYGVSHVIQFVFTGSVTLKVSNVTGPSGSEGGALQALFFD